MTFQATVSKTLVTSVLVLGLTGTALAQGHGHGHGAVTEFDDGEIYFELNNTDGDLGIHGLIDGGPWRIVKVRDANNKVILKLQASGQMTKQGMTQLFFESAEPTFDELSPEEFFARFPEGIYKILGRGHQGGRLESESLVRHVMPAPPEVAVNGQPVPRTCNDQHPDYDESLIPIVNDDEDVIISWEPVAGSHPTIGEPGDIEVQLYQFFIEVITLINGEEFSSKYAFDLTPNTTSIEVPDEILELGDEFKIEVLVKEAEGGNQTATESCFFVAEE